MLTLSRRARELGTENAFVVLGEIEKLVAEGREIVSFAIGQPDFPTPENIRMAGIKAIGDGRTGYTPSPGIAPLRDAVAAYFTRTRGVDVTGDEVVCGCGGKPFIAYAILSVTDHGAGHEVIYPNPGFPIYRSQVEASGAVPVPLHSARVAVRSTSILDELRAQEGQREHAAIDPVQPAQPHRRRCMSSRGFRGRSPRSSNAVRRPVGLLRRGLFRPRLRRRVPEHRRGAPACASARSSWTRLRRPTP